MRIPLPQYKGKMRASITGQHDFDLEGQASRVYFMKSDIQPLKDHHHRSQTP
tara:strand:+ start:416 stop:571 length:156 start_codon:yes stop_codon:yes gene_type:complete